MKRKPPWLPSFADGVYQVGYSRGWRTARPGTRLKARAFAVSMAYPCASAVAADVQSYPRDLTACARLPDEGWSMAVDLKRYRFTRTDYHRMAQVGILKPRPRVELIDGEIVEMSPIGRRHKASVDRVARIFHLNVSNTAIVRVQSSIVLDEYGEPEPDIALLRFRADFYAESDETPEDILLVVEVADSSDAYDRQMKSRLYARFRIPEMWVASLNRGQVFVYRDPTPEGYATIHVVGRGESVSPLAFPALTIAVDAILG